MGGAVERMSVVLDKPPPPIQMKLTGSIHTFQGVEIIAVQSFWLEPLAMNRREWYLYHA